MAVALAACSSSNGAGVASDAATELPGEPDVDNHWRRELRDQPTSP